MQITYFDLYLHLQLELQEIWYHLVIIQILFIRNALIMHRLCIDYALIMI